MLTPFRTANSVDFVRLLFVCAIWGSAFVFIDISLDSFGPITVAAFRVLMASVVLVVISVLTKKLPKLKSREWLIVTIVGLFNSALPFFLISWAQQYINAAEAAALMATGALSALIISHFTTLDERINAPRALGLIVGFGGILILFWDELQRADSSALGGLLAVTAAGICYASSTVLSRRVSHIPPITMATYTVSTALTYMLPLAIWLESPVTEGASFVSWTAVIYLGVISTALAYVIRFTIIRNNGAVFMSQAGYLVPVFGAFWGWLLLSNEISMTLLLSLLVILCGVAITRKGTT